MWFRLCALPYDLVGASVLSYLEQRDAVTWDTAMVKAPSREMLGAMFTSLRSTWNVTLVPMLTWALNRGVEIETVTVVTQADNVFSSLSTKLHMLRVGLRLQCQAANIDLICSSLTCSHVCKRVISLEMDENVRSVDALLLPALPEIEELRCASREVEEDWIVRVVNKSSRLTKLEIGFTSPSLHFFKNISVQAACLTMLTLQCFLSHEVLLEVGTHCPSLTSLHLRHMGSVLCVSVGLVHLAKGCELLRELHLYNMISGEAAALVALFTHCPRMTTLHAPHVALRDEAVQALARSFIFLVELAVVWHVESTEAVQRCSPVLLARMESFEAHSLHSGCIESLKAALQRMPCLTHVLLDSPSPLQASLLITLADNCPQVRSVCIDAPHLLGDADSAVAALARACGPRLQDMKLRAASELTSVGLLVLAEHCANLTNMLCRAKLVTDEGVLALMRRCSQLFALFLITSPLLTDAVLDCCSGAENAQQATGQWCDICPCPRLVNLHVGGSVLLTEAAVLRAALGLSMQRSSRSSSSDSRIFILAVPASSVPIAVRKPLLMSFPAVIVQYQDEHGLFSCSDDESW